MPIMQNWLRPAKSLTLLGDSLMKNINIRPSKVQQAPLLFSRWFLAACLVTAYLVSMPRSYAQADIPESQNYQGIQYITGGIGSEESDAMLQLGQRWPLTLEFAQDHPQRPLWVADVDVKITDNKRKVIFSALSEGPIMLIQLPAGSYEIEAKFEDRILKKKLKIEENQPVKLPIVWPIR
jgi:hypothetical protein